MNHKDTYKLVSRILLPELRNTIISTSGRISVPLDAESNSWRRKPKTLRMGTIRYSILKYIWDGGDEGRSFSDIQKFILGVKDNWPEEHYEYHNDWRTGNPRRTRHSRGQYSTFISNDLPHYAKKNSRGKWVIWDPNLLLHFYRVSR